MAGPPGQRLDEQRKQRDRAGAPFEERPYPGAACHPRPELSIEFVAPVLIGQAGGDQRVSPIGPSQAKAVGEVRRAASRRHHERGLQPLAVLLVRKRQRLRDAANSLENLARARPEVGEDPTLEPRGRDCHAPIISDEMQNGNARIRACPN